MECLAGRCWYLVWLATRVFPPTNHITKISDNLHRLTTRVAGKPLVFSSALIAHSVAPGIMMSGRFMCIVNNTAVGLKGEQWKELSRVIIKRCDLPTWSSDKIFYGHHGCLRDDHQTKEDLSTDHYRPHHNACPPAPPVAQKKNKIENSGILVEKEHHILRHFHYLNNLIFGELPRCK